MATKNLSEYNAAKVPDASNMTLLFWKDVSIRWKSTALCLRIST